MRNSGVYGNIKMSPKTADLLVLVTLALLIFTFIFAVSTAEKTKNVVAQEVTTQDCFISPVHIPYTFSELSCHSFCKTPRLIH